MTTVIYCNIGIGNPNASVKRYSELVVTIVKDAPKVSGKRGYYDLEGATYTAKASSLPIFQRYRVRSSIGDGDSTSKNEAAQSEKIAYG